MAELRNSFISWRISWVFVHFIFPLEPPGHWTLEINQKTKLSIWACKVLILLWYMTRDPENFITTSRHHIYDLRIERGGGKGKCWKSFFYGHKDPHGIDISLMSKVFSGCIQEILVILKFHFTPTTFLLKQIIFFREFLKKKYFIEYF